jgi:hypothetical protein
LGFGGARRCVAEAKGCVRELIKGPRMEGEAGRGRGGQRLAIDGRWAVRA